MHHLIAFDGTQLPRTVLCLVWPFVEGTQITYAHELRSLVHITLHFYTWNAITCTHEWLHGGGHGNTFRVDGGDMGPSPLPPNRCLLYRAAASAWIAPGHNASVLQQGGKGLILGETDTLPKFNSSPLKNDGWKMILSFWDGVFFQGSC